MRSEKNANFCFFYEGGRERERERDGGGEWKREKYLIYSKRTHTIIFGSMVFSGNFDNI